MSEDILSLELKKALTPNPRNNYMVDIAGRYGPKVKAPTLTNVDNTFTVSAHGAPFGGFTPDDSATNSLANAVRQKIESGSQLSLEDIAEHIGPATNSIKRAIIDACFAAGYNFNAVKKVFPNLEQLVAPSTSRPVSVAYLPDLVQKEPIWNQHIKRSLSPFFSITPTTTNVVRQVSDWLPSETAKQVAMPISVLEAEIKKKHGEGSNVWSAAQYEGKSSPPLDQIKKNLDLINSVYSRKLSEATNSTQIDKVRDEWRQAINDVYD